MSAITVALYARLGNAMFGYAHARARAEQGGHELRVAPWIGESLFTLDDYPISRPDGTEVEKLQGYFQNQASLIYSRADCRRWFKLKPEIEARVRGYALTWADSEFIHCHRRVGDYPAANYTVVSKKSYETAVRKFGYDPGAIAWVTEEDKFHDPYFDGWADFAPDFIRMMYAPVLFRGNSTFSWWCHAASPIGQRIFSPVVYGLGSGEHDVEFQEGNHNRFCSLEFVTDLILPECA